MASIKVEDLNCKSSEKVKFVDLSYLNDEELIVIGGTRITDYGRGCSIDKESGAVLCSEYYYRRR
jgi:hypothetical protein